ncbi:hypothetical protein BJF79_28730 [Actinomadura sp. CNU-125]|uniref:hypothetical protein n=1 Tax=Actinomadura sp. CNU-125 TaxID=1904961 RepID=UPI0009665179|nr:hypothetical protein [Actinomadura sp. CNU-125]OLT37886.1 hypothetical protein BJF79_28730 [Actinomadura sp. CNU-125]
MRLRTPAPLVAALGEAPCDGPLPSWSTLVEDAAALAEIPRGAAVTAEIVDGPGAPRLIAAARDRDLAVVGRVSDGFAPARTREVLAAVDRLVAAGCAEIAVDEGPGAASPLLLRNLLQDVVARARPVPVRVRLREAYGLGMANVLTALKSGVRHFDVTLGGIDGGLCAEDVLFLASRLGVATPADRGALVAAATDLEAIWGSALPGRTYRTAS